VLVDGCASGAGYRFSLPNARFMPNPSTASLDLAPPADGRAIALVGVRAWASTRFAGSGVQIEGSIDVTDAAWTYANALGDALSAVDPVSAMSMTQPATRLRLVLRCRQSDRPRSLRTDGNTCYLNDPTPLELRGIEVTLSEDTPPSGSAVGGTLLGSEPVSGVRSVDYSITDGESGLARIEVVIGDTVVASRELTGRCSYADFTACPTLDRDTLSIDTRNVPDGGHVLALRIFDAAGNRQDVQVQAVDVQNSPRSPGAAGGGLAKLTAGFTGSSRSSVIVPFGRQVTVRGRLKRLSGAGLAKAQVEVFERSVRPGAKEVSVGRARTRSDGTFTYTLARGRPSRSVRLAYGSTASSGPLQVRVRAASTLKATLRGILVRFSGRVLSRPLPARGKIVKLQGKAPGFPWSRFVTLRTDRHGRFAGSYRLRAHRPGVKVQIRVVVPTERGYPYLSYHGRPVTLKVR
jgi:hypothetical protein